MLRGDAVPTVAALVILILYGMLLIPQLVFARELPKRSLNTLNHLPDDSREKPHIVGRSSIPKKWLPLGVCLHRGDEPEPVGVSIDDKNHLELQLVHKKKPPKVNKHRRIPRGIQKLTVGSGAVSDLLLELDGVEHEGGTRRIRKRHDSPKSKIEKRAKHGNVKKKQISGSVEAEFSKEGTTPGSSDELGKEAVQKGPKLAGLDDILGADSATVGSQELKEEKKSSGQRKFSDLEKLKYEIPSATKPKKPDTYSLPYEETKRNSRKGSKEVDSAGASGVQLDDEAVNDDEEHDDEETEEVDEGEDGTDPTEVPEVLQDASKAEEEHEDEDENASDNLSHDDIKQQLESVETFLRNQQSKRTEKKTNEKPASTKPTKAKTSTTAVHTKWKTVKTTTTKKPTTTTTVPPLGMCTLPSTKRQKSTPDTKEYGETCSFSTESCLPTEIPSTKASKIEISASITDVSSGNSAEQSSEDYAKPPKQPMNSGFMTPYPDHQTTDSWYATGTPIESSTIGKPTGTGTPSSMNGNEFTPDHQALYEVGQKPMETWAMPITDQQLQLGGEVTPGHAGIYNAIVFVTPATRISFTEMPPSYIYANMPPEVPEATTRRPLIGGIPPEEIGEETTTIRGPEHFYYEDIPDGMIPVDPRSHEWHDMAVPYALPFPAILPPRVPMGAYMPHVIGASPLQHPYEVVPFDPMYHGGSICPTTASPVGVKKLPGYRHHKIQGENVELSQSEFANTILEKIVPRRKGNRVPPKGPPSNPNSVVGRLRVPPRGPNPSLQGPSLASQIAVLPPKPILPLDLASQPSMGLQAQPMAVLSESHGQGEQNAVERPEPAK